MATSTKTTTKTSDPVKTAEKVVNRAIKAAHRVGNLKDLKENHINKIESALKGTFEKAMNKLRRPSASDNDFSLS